MIQNRLRLYCGPEEETVSPKASFSPKTNIVSQKMTLSLAEHQQKTVTISAGEVFSALADAIQHKRRWLRDFEQEELTIPTDLYEVILAYQHFRRPSA